MPVADQAREFVAARKLPSVATISVDRRPSSQRNFATAGRRVDPNAAAPAAEVPAPHPPTPGSRACIRTISRKSCGTSAFRCSSPTTRAGTSLRCVRTATPSIRIICISRSRWGSPSARDRLIIGTETGIREFRNVPAVAKRLVPPNRNDAVYVFRKHHVTGNINIHEMALGANNECWFVNTRFSCLCTLDAESSFRPRWRPGFISALSPDDRCHLNGLAMVNGQPRWLTALGATDTAQGWRANTKDGGVVIDYATREVIVRGLSMPHSPRWYRNRFWFLESGRGSLATIDLASGKVKTVARLPGFTRGLDFVGPLAFVGLSQLRETNPLTDIPITEENVDRMSGVWVVNIETGETIAILKFGDAVQEIFAVQAMPGVLFPEMVDEDKELLPTIFALPDEAYKDVRYVAPARQGEGALGHVASWPRTEQTSRDTN